MITTNPTRIDHYVTRDQNGRLHLHKQRVERYDDIGLPEWCGDMLDPPIEVAGRSQDELAKWATENPPSSDDLETIDFAGQVLIGIIKGYDNATPTT